eukprot:TRINITY_DN20971_c0_g1_i1.p1 TRINITY_DN20971_c0_g1~~TRINITY_DN20971_c0_g1_i1.p1  ORF type:complete len:457 (-),score=134.31 TRINITY_DN20971_c0_g1_i1:14-1222(-)
MKGEEGKSGDDAEGSRHESTVKGRRDAKERKKQRESKGKEEDEDVKDTRHGKSSAEKDKSRSEQQEPIGTGPTEDYEDVGKIGEKKSPIKGAKITSKEDATKYDEEEGKAGESSKARGDKAKKGAKGDKESESDEGEVEFEEHDKAEDRSDERKTTGKEAKKPKASPEKAKGREKISEAGKEISDESHEEVEDKDRAEGKGDKDVGKAVGKTKKPSRGKKTTGGEEHKDAKREGIEKGGERPDKKSISKELRADTEAPGEVPSDEYEGEEDTSGKGIAKGKHKKPGYEREGEEASSDEDKPSKQPGKDKHADDRTKEHRPASKGELISEEDSEGAGTEGKTGRWRGRDSRAARGEEDFKDSGKEGLKRGKTKTSGAEGELSLIHICRCRRIERCRSRWSPYH